jgi:flagellar hook-length control protein FliK
MPVANDKATANSAAGADHKPSDNAGHSSEQETPDQHKLQAKQEPSGVVADKNKTHEPAGADRSSALPTVSDFSKVIHQESSGVQNVQAQISGATIPHPTREGNGSAPVRAANAADVLDAASTIVKDGNRLAVKFEQDGLGKLDIDLRLNKGILSAHIQAADNSTKTLIENNMQQIVDSLMKAGLSVGGFSVSLKGGGQQNMTQEEYNGKTGQATGVLGAVVGSAPRGASDGLVSIFI